MVPSPDGPTPPEGVPQQLADTLPDLTSEELRNTILFARELLQSRDARPSPVEPGARDDILRVTERDGYTEVVKTDTYAEGCADCPHGPYLYHVREEARPEGGTQTRWTFIGDVYPAE